MIDRMKLIKMFILGACRLDTAARLHSLISRLDLFINFIQSQESQGVKSFFFLI